MHSPEPNRINRLTKFRITRISGIVFALAFVAALVSSAVPSSSAAPPRPFGDVRALATVPAPGFPEGIAIKGDRVYVAGPAKFGTTGGGPSHVFAFDRKTGALVRSYPTQGEDLLAEHANSCVAFDAAGRLYVLNTQLGIYRLDTETGQQEPYAAPFPNLPACVPGVVGAPCSPTLADVPALPNDIAFAEDGAAYVTDAMQATIWRVAPGGGQPQIWFQDARFAAAYIGVNGIRLSPDRTRVYVTVTTDLLGQAYVYTLPLTPAPQAGDLSVFHHFAADDLPDGIAFGESGLLYVTIATPLKSGIVVLRQDGTEAARLKNPLLSPISPYDSPANLAFDGDGALLVTNHAFATGLPSQFTVLDVFVKDDGSPLALPALP